MGLSVELQQEVAVARADIMRDGERITFGRFNGDANYDPETNTFDWLAADSLIEGWATQVGSNSQTYAALGLVEANAPTVKFVPLVRGGPMPKEGDVTVWRNEGATTTKVDIRVKGGEEVLANIIISI